MTEETLTVLVDRITYTNPQNGFSVLRTSCREYPGGITMVGLFGPIHPGEEIRVYGVWTHHPQFGPQFQVIRYSVLKPATLKGIEKYLGSGLIKGIGPVTAKKIVKKFGMQSLEIIDKHPELLTTCEGIGKVRAEKIVQGWAQQKAIQDVMLFLQSHGVSTAYALRIFKTLGNQAISLVSQNPYILAQEIRGIGFKTADKIASEFGITGDDPRRIEAGIQFVLLSVLDEGHIFLPREKLITKVQEILGIDNKNAINSGIDQLISCQKLVSSKEPNFEAIYLPFIYRAEHGSVEEIIRLMKFQPKEIDREKFLTVIEKAVSDSLCNLSDTQQLAIELSLQKPILIITGGPGTGKTTTLKALVKAHVLLHRRVLLASPTGRAAKRLSEVCNFEALTIHRLLEFSPNENKFKRDRNNPLKCDTLIVDEASMIDMELFYALLKATPTGSAFVLVGDVDQLPSVGPGLVLKNLIDSNVIPVIRLQTIFRQAESSMIITNAHKVNNGQMPILIEPDGKTKTDFYFLEAPDPEKALNLLKTVVESSLPKRFAYRPIEDIQVLAPMHRGHLGCGNLNEVLQKTLNPPAPNKNELKQQHRIFRCGDKVIQTKNNYDLEVYNGDIGIIKAIDTEDHELTVEFPHKTVVYQKADMLDLAHAFAITVHKSQGSEYPAVVLLLSMQDYPMLQRNLLYTAITRAKKTLVLIGTKKAIAIAIRNNQVRKRYSLFCELLKRYLSHNKQQNHIHNPKDTRNNC